MNVSRFGLASLPQGIGPSSLSPNLTTQPTGAAGSNSSTPVPPRGVLPPQQPSTPSEVNTPKGVSYISAKLAPGQKMGEIVCGKSLSDQDILNLLKYSTIVRSPRLVSTGATAAVGSQIVFFTPVQLRECLKEITKGLVSVSSALAAKVKKAELESAQLKVSVDKLSSELASVKSTHARINENANIQLQQNTQRIAQLTSQKADAERELAKVHAELAALGDAYSVGRTNPLASKSLEGMSKPSHYGIAPTQMTPAPVLADNLISELMNNLAKLGVVGYKYGDSFVYEGEVNPLIKSNMPKWADWKKRNPEGRIVPAKVLVDTFRRLVNIACESLAELERNRANMELSLKSLNREKEQIASMLVLERQIGAPTAGLAQKLSESTKQLAELTRTYEDIAARVQKARVSLNAAVVGTPPTIIAPDMVGPTPVVEPPAVEPEVVVEIVADPTSEDVPEIAPPELREFAAGEVDLAAQCVSTAKANQEAIAAVKAAKAKGGITQDDITKVERLLDEIEECNIKLSDAESAAGDAESKVLGDAIDTVDSLFDTAEKDVDALKKQFAAQTSSEAQPATSAPTAAYPDSPSSAKTAKEKKSHTGLIIGGLVVVAAAGTYAVYRKRKSH